MVINTSIQALAIIPFSILSILGSGDKQNLLSPLAGENLLAQKQISLENRYLDKWVSNVFKDNILLNLAYLNGTVSSKSDINWDNVTKPYTFEFRLDPNQTFAFHEDVDQKYKDSLVKTTNAHFNAADGFKTDGYLYGDGVCHLASLIYWSAKEAGLEAEAPTNHNFAQIPDIPKEYGVSIYNNPHSKGSNTRQNLYITNNKEKAIAFKFDYDGQNIKVSVVELN